MKKSSFLSCLLIFLMVVSMITGVIPVLATTSGDYAYNDNGDGTCTITNYSGTGGAVIIPSTLDGITVAAIEEQAFANKGLTSVTIPNSVKSIGRWAFQGNSDLISVTLPNGITSIGDYAFQNNPKLASIEIPSSVTSIADYTFSYCRGLTSVTIPGSVTSIGKYAFRSTALTSVTIPSSVLSIGEYAFAACSSLTKAHFDGNIPILGDGVFEPVTSYEIGDYTCSNNGDGTCTITGYSGAVEEIIIPSTLGGLRVTVIGNTALSGEFKENCFALTSVKIPDGVTSIGEGAFDCCENLSSVTIPASVTSIGDYAFNDCIILSKVKIPASVTSIGSYVFNDCKSLSSITIPDSVTSIEEGAFAGCVKLTSVTLPANLTSIGGFAFNGCTSLTDTMIPASVTSIGENAFNCCSSLTSVTIPDGFESIGDGAFAESGLTGSITIPASVTSIAQNAFIYCYKLTGINVDAGNQNYSSVYGILYDKDQSDLLFCPFGLTSVTIPYGVISILDNAFYECSGFTSVTIPASVTSIGRYAFCNCSKLASVYFDGTPTMNEGTEFSNCSDSLSFFCPTGNSAKIKYGSLTPAKELDTKPITVAAAVYDYITPSIYAGMPGETISLKIKPTAGYVLQNGSLKYNDGSDHAISGTSFTMPEANITVSGEFEAIPPATIAVTGVTLNKNSTSIEKGSSETLTAAVAPADATNKNLTWSSDQPGIASVDQTGKITAVAAGTATVTVTTADGNKTATCRVTVTESARIAVTGVILNKTSISIEKGNSEILTATVAPEAANKNITWSTDQTGIASVDQSGKVTAVAAGTATIIVTTADGKKTAACQVTVTESATASTDQTIPISGPVNVTVPKGVTGAKIDIDPVNPLPLIKVNASTAHGTIQAEIPAGTTVSGPAGWNGEITLPTVKASPSATITGAQTIDTVIEVGLGNDTIKFSKAVRLLIPNMAGKAAGYVRNGVFTPITATISADSQNTADAEIPDGGEAKITVGNDLVIWTKHFTEFIAYTPVTNYPGSGSGGGGTYVAQTVNTTTGSATVYPTAGGKVGLGSDATVEIPANALPGNSGVMVKVQKVEFHASIPEGFNQGSDIFDFTVDGKTSYSFNKPVTITLKCSTTADSIPAIYNYDSQSSQWIKVGGTVSGSTISASTDHFTKYIVLVKKQNENSPQPQSPAANNQSGLTDLNKHWAKQFIEKLVGLGAVSGYPDGTFKPDAPVTRAEFITILAKALKLTTNSNRPAFKDTAGHWASNYISIAAESGLINGYGDNYFKPDSLITREEMAVIAIKAIKLQQAGRETSFIDNARISSWAKDSMRSIVNSNIMTGYPDNTIRPQGNTTRAEAVTVIVKFAK